MSKRRREKLQQELPLFDFPLDGNAETPETPAEAPDPPPRRGSAPNLQLVPKTAPAEPHETTETGDEPDTDRPDRGDRAGLGSRLLAGGLDLAIHAAVLGAVFTVVRFALGVRPSAASWPAFALFALIFSFLYTAVPLAFWGQTPGMTWRHLIARSLDGEPLTFAQTASRWFGALATIALAGLPLLLALLSDGRSLADLLSGSRVSPL